MARIRNIKPDFFTDENIVELDFETRLLFIGLWTLADREGRLENKPKKIKMQLFPCDGLDVAAKLRCLHGKGMVQLYSVDNQDLIQITNFAEHQRPHAKEAPSTLPAPKLTGKPRNSPASRLDNGDGDGDGDRNGDGDGTPNGVEEPRRKAKPRKPIDENFTPPAKDLEKMAKECPDVDIKRETSNFIDHYLGNGELGKDWTAYWRKWIRRQQGWANERKPKTPETRAPDIMDRDYPGATYVTFEVGMIAGTSTGKLSTRDDYEQFKSEWLEKHPQHANEVTEYESGREFRERFGKAEQVANSTSPSTGRSNGNGQAQTSMPVPR